MAGNDVLLRSVPADADQDDVRLYDPTTADAGGGGAFTLTVDPATVAITGQSVALRADRQLAVSLATVAIAGQSITLALMRRVTVSPATLPIAGQSVTLRAARQLVSTPDTAAITGQSVILRVAYRLIASPATALIAGQSVDLSFTGQIAGFTLDVSPGTLAIGGQSVTLTFAAAPPVEEEAEEDFSSGGAISPELTQLLLRRKREKAEAVAIAAQVARDRQADKDLETLLTAVKIKSDPMRMQAALAKRVKLLDDLLNASLVRG